MNGNSFIGVAPAVEGDSRTLDEQTVGGFDARIKTAEGNVAQLSLTVGGFNTRITATEEGLEGAETHISAIERL